MNQFNPEAAANQLLDECFGNVVNRVREHRGLEKKAFGGGVGEAAYGLGFKLLPALFFSMPFVAGGMSKYFSHQLDHQKAVHDTNMADLNTVVTQMRKDEEREKRKKRLMGR